MNNVQENIRRVQDLHEQVRGHCMCRAIVDEGCYIRVIYPEGDWPEGIDGVQCEYGLRNGKAEALQKLLDRMEADWLNSFPVPKKPVKETILSVRMAVSVKKTIHGKEC